MANVAPVTMIDGSPTPDQGAESGHELQQVAQQGRSEQNKEA
jgi:hypothetical protein